MTPVIHAAPSGDNAYEVRSLEAGERAVVVTTPIKRRTGSRWNWIRGEFVTIPTAPASRFCRVPECEKWGQWRGDGMCMAHFRERQEAAKS